MMLWRETESSEHPVCYACVHVAVHAVACIHNPLDSVFGINFLWIGLDLGAASATACEPAHPLSVTRLIETGDAAHMFHGLRTFPPSSHWHRVLPCPFHSIS
jgi:hypothetical protein